MYAFTFRLALSLLFVTSASSADVQLRALTTGAGFITNATTTESSSVSTSTPASTSLTRGGLCRIVVHASSTVSVANTITEFATQTIYATVTSTLAEPTLAARAGTELLPPKHAIPCSDCAESSPEGGWSQFRAAEHPVLEIRDSSTLTGSDSACGASNGVVTVSIGATTVTSARRVTIMNTKIVNPPPKTLTSIDSLGGTSKKDAGTVSSETPAPVSGPTSFTIAPHIATSLTGFAPLDISQPPETTTNAAKISTSESSSTVTFSAPATVAPFTQTLASALTPLSIAISPKIISPPEIGTSTSNTAPPTIITSSPATPEVTSNAQPAISAPLGISSKPGPGQTESENKVQPSQTSNAVQIEKLPTSVPQIISTQIPVQKATTTTVQAAPPIITLGTNTFPPLVSSSVYVINSQTLVLGGPAITLSNSVLSLATSGTQLVVAPTGPVNNGQPASPATTIRLSSNPTPIPGSASAPNPLSPPIPTPVIATVGNSPITLEPSASSLVFTPSSGPPITILQGSPAVTLPGGTIISLSPATPNSPSASSVAAAAAPPVLIISTPGAPSPQRITFPTQPPPSTTATLPGANYILIAITAPPYIILGDTANGGITLTPGAPSTTISGIPVSLGTSDEILVLGSSTITIAASAGGVGAYLYSGLGGGSTSTRVGGSGSGGMVTSTLTGSRSAGVSGSENATVGRSSSSTQPQLQSTAGPVSQSNAAARAVSPMSRGTSRVMNCLAVLLLGAFVLR